MRKLMSFIVSGEFIFAAFLLSSVFKSAVDEIFPFDITILLMIFSGGLAIKKIMTRKVIPRKILLPIFLYYLFASFILVTNFYSDSQIYALDKTLRFFIVSGWSFVGVFFLIDNKESVVKFLKSLIFITVLTSIYVFYDYLTSSDVIVGFTRFGVDGGNVIGLARITGIATLACLLTFLYMKNSWKIKLSGYLIITFFIFILLLTGSRMPLIALILSVLLTLLLSVKIQRGKIKLYLGSLLLFIFFPIIYIFAIPFYNLGYMETIFTRLFNLTLNDASALERVRLMDFAKQLFVESPIIGHGIGSFTINYTGIDTKYYPHNIFLEILSELGLIGFILFGLLLLFTFSKFVQEALYNLNPVQIAVIVITFYLFVNANVSGDLNDNRILYTFLALTIVLRSFRSNLSEKI